jgi:cytochrome b involved in lipid metabolism
MREVALHNSRYDCWTVYNKKVYNISQYLEYHPGGVPKLMESAGRDCTELFNRYHRWVNCDSIIGICLVGTLVEETPSIPEEEDEVLRC